MSPELSKLLSILPKDMGSQAAGRLVQKIARQIQRDETLSVTLLDALGTAEQDELTEQQLTTLLIAALDDARTAQENGRSAGASFIKIMERQVSSQSAAGAITSPATC